MSQVLLRNKRRVALCTLEKSKWNCDVMTSTSYSKCKNEKYKATLTEDASVPYLGRNAICMYINVYYIEILKRTSIPFFECSHHHVTCDLQLLWQWFSKYSLEIFWKSFNIWQLFNLVYSCLLREFKANKKFCVMRWFQIISMTESLQLWKQMLLWELLIFTKSSRNLINWDLGFGTWMLRAVAPCRWHFFHSMRSLDTLGKTFS